MANSTTSKHASAFSRCRLGALFLFFAFTGSARATSCVMTAWSGSDGTFTTIPEGGYPTVYQATGTPGDYSSFMYFQRPVGVTFASGATLYVEVDYLDESGNGNIGIQYDATATQGSAFVNCNFAVNASVLNTGVYKSAVFELPDASFDYKENGGNDMRLTQAAGSFQFNVIQVTVSDQPMTLYTQDTAFLGPYSGPAYAGQQGEVSATSILSKVLCGYQGWFGAPGDTDNVYWSHWSSNPSVFTNSTLQIDPWPDMSEYTSGEQYDVSGYTYSGGGQASLFSSDNFTTVLRHFQWMSAWNIDGVALQRFEVSVGSGCPCLPMDRTLTYVRQAANETGRVWYVEYDMTGMTEADITPTMSTDWQYLVDTLQVTSDSRYLHQNGLPVVGVYGFFPARFSATTAQDILNIFSTSGSTPAFVAGAGEWYWRTDSAWTGAWDTVLYQMGSWQPWNTGNETGASPDYATTNYWAADKAQLAANGSTIYQPQIYPGTSSNNRDGTTGAPVGLDRLEGGVLWNEFTALYALGLSGGVEQPQSVFLGMFDEFSEGTQIAKTTNTPPTQPVYTITNEGLPSDCWLCFTSLGAQMLKGTYAYTTATPNCAGLTQPTIPVAVAPLTGASDPAGNVTFSWDAALALSGGGSLTTYQILLNGVTITTNSLNLGDTLALAAGTYVWQVRAENSLGNYGGWSIAQTFTVTGATATPTRTVTPSSTPTPSASPSPTPTGTASPTGTPTASPSATPTGTASPSVTYSPSPSATPTPSLSAGPSSTQSPSRTVTLTPNLSATVTLTGTASPSPTVSPTPSETGSPSPSRSPSPSATLTGTASPSLTASPSPSATGTSSFSPSPSPSVTATATPTPSGTATSSLTATPTPVPSASPTCSSSPTPSATPRATPTATAQATATATPAYGPGGVLKAVPWPNPNPRQIAVELGGRSALTLRLYTESLYLAAEVYTPAEGPGWVSIALPAAFLNGTSDGTYYYRVADGPSDKGMVGRLVILR